MSLSVKQLGAAPPHRPSTATNGGNSGTPGRDIVLIHGWGLHCGVFDDLAAALAQTRRVTLVDLPGHGRNHDLPFPDDLDTLTEAIAQAVPRHACWLGWSLGGLVALQHAVARPADTAATILVAATPRFVSAGHWPGLSATTLEAFARSLRHDYHDTLQRFLALQVQGCANRGDLLRQLKQQLQRYPSPSPRALEGGLSLLSHCDLRPQLADIASPTLLLYGELDRIVPAEAGHACGQMIPGSRVHYFNKAGHAPFLSHPQEVLAVINAFLDDI